MTPLAELLADRIRRFGPLTFADYMRECLYHPVHGYYSKAEFVEAGAGAGRFAAQVLDFCEAKLPAFYDALRYVAVERSVLRREQATIHSKRYAAADHFTSSAEVPAHIAAGCFFSNELVDALPVHRVVMDGGTLKEILVGFRRVRAHGRLWPSRGRSVRRAPHARHASCLSKPSRE